MENFTPVSALVGGSLIGLAAAMVLLLMGRIAGISGILGAMLRVDPGPGDWRIGFLIGLIGAPLAMLIAGMDIPRGAPGVNSTLLLVIAGLLVGAGTRIGSGCTSGHGVCGVARFSKRSLTATAIFMAIAIGTVFVTQHLAGGV